MGKYIKRTLLPLFMQVVMFATLAACNNSVEEVSRTQPIVEPPTPSVSVALNQELQTAMTLDGQLSLQLSIDDVATPATLLDGPTARIDLSAQQMQGEHRYYIAMHYTAKGADKALLVAEAEKLISSTQVQFTAEDLQTEPYDKDKSGTIEMAEQQILDEDTDTQSNLSEILAGGNPQNPGPTFVSANQIQIPQKVSKPGGEYTVYTARGLSPLQSPTLTYSLVGGADLDRFRINADSGELGFVDNTDNGGSLSWPTNDPAGNNDYNVDIQVNDGKRSNIMTVTVSVAYAFDLSVSFGIKTLQFAWFYVPNAAYYALLENPDGNSGYSEVAGASRITSNGNNLQGFKQTVALHRFDALNARYLLQAFDADGNLLITSEALDVAAGINDAIGYFKRQTDAAGSSIGGPVLSADGNTMVALGGLGCYVFRLDNGNWSLQEVISPNYNGAAVALSADGNTLAIGKPNESSAAKDVNDTTVGPTDTSAPLSGAVYVLNRSSNTAAFVFKDYIKAPNSEAGDYFGSAISLSADGNTLAVGATGESSAAKGITTLGAVDNSAVSSGAAYVYRRTTNTASFVFKDYIKAPNSEAKDFFGKPVALSADGNILAVGAHREDGAATDVNDPTIDPTNNSAPSSGAVYVYRRSANADRFTLPLNKIDYIKATYRAAYLKFAYALALSADGNTLAVGAVGDNSALNSGEVFVYDRISNTVSFAAKDYIKMPNAKGSAWFGSAVALSADANTLAVGARFESSAARGIYDATNGQADYSATYSGAVFVFSRAANTDSFDLPQDKVSYIKAPNSDAGDYFGASVALDAGGNTLAVTAPFEGSPATGIGGDQSDDCNNADGTYNPTPKNCARGSGAVYLY